MQSISTFCGPKIYGNVSRLSVACFTLHAANKIPNMDTHIELAELEMKMRVQWRRTLPLQFIPRADAEFLEIN